MQASRRTQAHPTSKGFQLPGSNSLETKQMERNSIVWLFFTACLISFSLFVDSANEVSLVIGLSTTLQISPSWPVEKSPGSKPVLCERVQIHGLPRLKNLKKYAHSVKVKVSNLNTSARPPNAEVCFHWNHSLGVGMCPQGQWEKLIKGSWLKSMSPFDHRLLDVRMAASSKEILQVSIVEEFFWHHIIFLVVGIIMLTLASSLSKSLVFYYSSAMAIGIILVILMVLFQGMKLLPTGRKNSVAIFVYSSIVGLGSFLLRYLPRLLHSVLGEMGITEDMYYPLAMILLIFLVLAGSWLGFWVVRKLVLTEDGLIDRGISHFVAWSIRVIAAVMILQSSEDPLLAAAALLCGIQISLIFRRTTRSRFIRRLYKTLRYRVPSSSPLKASFDEYRHDIQKITNSESWKPRSGHFTMASCGTRVPGFAGTPPSQRPDSGTYYSSFHTTPERRKFSKEEWETFTRDSTKKALEELVSSPDFSKWAVAHADRITLTPDKKTPDHRPRWLLPWF